MAARVIHFGVDDCYRLNVLRRAGYEIDDCRNLIQFRAALGAETDADAVMVSDSDGNMLPEAVSVARSQTSAPIVLFPNAGRNYRTAEIDLMVPCYTPPEEWLLDLANLIDRSRAVRAYSQMLQERSQQLRRESAALCEKSRRERRRSDKELDVKHPSPFGTTESD